MIVKGNRRGGAKQLADHILRRDTNEDMIIREIADFPSKQLSDDHLRSALNLMAAQGQAKGKLRTLYHSILAPQEGEVLNAKQLKHAVDTLAKNLGMEGHQRIIVEHRKAGRQHFHVVFNILHPGTGKQARLQWTRKIEWNTSRQLEQELGLKPVIAKGRPARRWEAERGKRSGIDPLQVRKEVTAIYKASKTGNDFIAALDKAGYVLTRGRNNNYVLVDRAGDIHGLMRRIEGAKVKDLRQKFPDLKNIGMPSLDSVLKQRRPVPVNKKVKRFISSAASVFTRTAKSFSMPLRHRAASLSPILHNGVAALMASLSAKAARQASYEARKNEMRNAAFPILRRRKRKPDENKLAKGGPTRAEIENAELLAWAWENGRSDILAQFGIILPPDYFEP
jgi:hypothetical protein